MIAKLSTFAAAVMAVVVAIAVPAHANTYYFTYTDLLGDTASGTLTTGSLDPANSYGYNNQSYPNPGYDITGITGTWDGQTITGLLGFAVCCSSPADDNILYTSGLSLDLAGLGFATATLDVNIYWQPVATPPSYWALSAPSGTPVDYANLGAGTFTVTPTPLPAALPLFATGLGALGLLGWRRKRKSPRTMLPLAAA
jgi:hypothetical protein